jgi:hypothetical protein
MKRQHFFFFLGRCLLLFWCCVVTFRWWDTHRLFSFFYQERERESEWVYWPCAVHPLGKKTEEIGKKVTSTTGPNCLIWVDWLSTFFFHHPLLFLSLCFRFLPTYQFLRVFYPTILWSFLWSMCRQEEWAIWKETCLSSLYYYQRCRDCTYTSQLFLFIPPTLRRFFFPFRNFSPLYPARFSIRSSLLSLPRFSLSSLFLFLSFSFFPFCPLAGLKNEPECRLES